MFDTEKFICAIELRPCLYDVASKEYSNRRLKAQSWSDVCEEMVGNWNELTKDERDFKAKELMKKWKALRDNYVKEFKEQKKVQTGVPAKKRKTYVFFEQLSFLAPHVHRDRGERSTSSVGPPQIVEENTESEQENTAVTELNDSGTITETVKLAAVADRQKRRGTSKHSRTAIVKSIASTTKDLTRMLSQSVEEEREERSADKYGNKLFLMSFIPLMDNLPLNIQMEVRLKIAQVFNDFSCMIAVPSPSPCPSSSSSSITTSNANYVQYNNIGTEHHGEFDT